MVQIGPHHIPSTAPPCSQLHNLVSALPPPLSLSSTGSKATNTILNLLKCEVKHGKRACPQCGDVWKDCVVRQNEHDKCFKSIMGSGVYGVKKDCGEELERFVICVERRAKVARILEKAKR